MKLTHAVLTIGVVPAEPWLTWDDGEITIAPSELEGTAA